MALEIEKTGKTVEAAKQAALDELQVNEDMVSFEVINEPSKGFLGMFGSKPDRVKAVVRDFTPAEKAEKFLNDILHPYSAI